MAQKTLKQLIDGLIWFDLPAKLKEILRRLLESISTVSVFIEDGTNTTVAGTGTEGDPYIISAGGGIEEAPLDGGPYGRQAANWVEVINIPHLEFNTTDKTVWNNGKSDFSNNTSFGEGALKSFTGGAAGNSAFGRNSLSELITGYQNTAVGITSLQYTTTGISNTAVGSGSLQRNTTGSYNIAIGSGAGFFISGGVSYNATSSNSVFLGSDTKPLANGQSNQIVIGYNTVGNGNNTATIGNDSIIETYLKGKVITNNTVRLKSYTVATLPSGVEGDTAYVTDATAPTYLGTLTGGGTVKCPVFYNGSAWISH